MPKSNLRNPSAPQTTVPKQDPQLRNRSHLHMGEATPHRHSLKSSSELRKTHKSASETLQKRAKESRAKRDPSAASFNKGFNKGR